MYENFRLIRRRKTEGGGSKKINKKCARWRTARGLIGRAPLAGLSLFFETFMSCPIQFLHLLFPWDRSSNVHPSKSFAAASPHKAEADAAVLVPSLHR